MQNLIFYTDFSQAHAIFKSVQDNTFAEILTEILTCIEDLFSICAVKSTPYNYFFGIQSVETADSEKAIFAIDNR